MLKKYGKNENGVWGIFKNKNIPGYSVIYGRTVFDMMDKVEAECKAPEDVSTEMYPSYEMAYAAMRK